jgi:hypothetical protein
VVEGAIIPYNSTQSIANETVLQVLEARLKDEPDIERRELMNLYAFIGCYSVWRREGDSNPRYGF